MHYQKHEHEWITVKTNFDQASFLPKFFFLNSCCRCLYLQISRKGHSRVPVYEGERGNIVGVLFVKSLIMLDPDDALPIKDVYKAGSFLKSSTTEPLFELLDNFQSGKSNRDFFVVVLPKGFFLQCKNVRLVWSPVVHWDDSTPISFFLLSV